MSTPPPGPVVGEDGRARCPWAAPPGVMRDYHDTEWGRPVHGEAAHLERMTLEAFQSGLSWATILAKRPAFRHVFVGFDADRVAAFDEADVVRLLTDARIVRNRRKIEAAVTNARATVALRAEGGLERLLRDAARPDAAYAPVTTADVVASTPASTALARDLKRRGFAHVGPTTMHALMEAVGLVDAHLVGCHRRGSSRG